MLAQVVERLRDASDGAGGIPVVLGGVRRELPAGARRTCDSVLTLLQPSFVPSAIPLRLFSTLACAVELKS